MLQDYQSGRTLELDPIVGAVREMGEMAGVPTPTIDTIYALARKKAEVKALSPTREVASAAVKGVPD